MVREIVVPASTRPPTAEISWLAATPTLLLTVVVVDNATRFTAATVALNA